jgi:hypothetical protein
MDKILAQAPAIVQMISLILSVLTVMATVIVRLPFAKKYSQEVSGFGKGLVKVLHWLPTIGINPQTAKLEETIMQLREATQPGV